MAEDEPVPVMRARKFRGKTLQKDICMESPELRSNLDSSEIEPKHNDSFSRSKETEKEFPSEENLVAT